MLTADKIIKTTQNLFARRGYDGVSMRVLANHMRISPSVIYHYFDDKDLLLKSMYEQTNKSLGEARALLPMTSSFEDNITQLIRFQFDHMQQIVAVLKYYLHFRSVFLRMEEKTLPHKAILHVQEVLQPAVDQGYFKGLDVEKVSKHIAHIINGYILEIFPMNLEGKVKEEHIIDISNFIIHALDTYKV